MSGSGDRRHPVPSPFNLDDFFTWSNSSHGQPLRSPFEQPQRSPFHPSSRNGSAAWDSSPLASPSNPHGGRHMSFGDSSPLFRTPSVQSVSSGHSEGDDQFWEVLLDVGEFELEEIVVRGIEHRVVVHAKHEEKVCGLDYVSREFSRQYVLPSNVEPETVTASLSPENILSIKAPKITVKPPPKERIIPITRVASKPPDKINHVVDGHSDTGSESDATTATESTSSSSLSTNSEPAQKHDSVDPNTHHNGHV